MTTFWIVRCTMTRPIDPNHPSVSSRLSVQFPVMTSGIADIETSRLDAIDMVQSTMKLTDGVLFQTLQVFPDTCEEWLRNPFAARESEEGWK